MDMEISASPLIKHRVYIAEIALRIGFGAKCNFRFFVDINALRMTKAEKYCIILVAILVS